MATLTLDAIGELLEPYAGAQDLRILEELSLYLDLLMKWNLRTNLTAIRDPVEIVRRHFGESLFAARHLGGARTLLDYGSGAGFPGLPIALASPAVSVTLAESQHKKASFLKETVRSLGVSATVWSARVEDMPSATCFDCITLRAVDRMASSIQSSSRMASGTILLLTSSSALVALPRLDEWEQSSILPVPESSDRLLVTLARR